MKVAFTFNKKNPFSRLIALVTKSQWSHCFMIVSDLYGDSVIAEAAFHGGIKLNLLSRYQNPDNYVLEIFDLGNIETKESGEILLSKVGDRYGYIQILGNLVARIFAMKKNPITDDEVCSEYAYLVLKASKIGLYLPDIDSNKISPGELREMLLKLSSAPNG